MSRITIEKIIYLEPRYLNSKISEHLLEKIREEFLGRCDQTYGYITKVYEKIQILNNSISSSSSGVFFRTRFNAMTNKPCINEEYEGKVCMIFPNGIFVEVFEKMKVLVPTDKLEGYNYIKSNTTFKNGSNVISKGDKIIVKISMIKYEKQNFNCIGSLKTY